MIALGVAAIIMAGVYGSIKAICEACDRYNAR